MEVLVALFLLATTLTAAYSAYRFLYFRTPELEAGGRLQADGAACLYHIERDMLAIYVTPQPLYQAPQEELAQDPFRFQCAYQPFGERRLESLVFATMSAPISMTPGITRVRYYLEQNKKGLWRLRRNSAVFPHNLPPKTPNDPILCDDLHSLRFEFADEQGQLQEYWDSESAAFDFATPRAVGIRFEITSAGTQLPFATRWALPVYRQALPAGSDY